MPDNFTVNGDVILYCGVPFGIISKPNSARGISHTERADAIQELTAPDPDPAKVVCPLCQIEHEGNE